MKNRAELISIQPALSLRDRLSFWVFQHMTAEGRAIQEQLGAIETLIDRLMREAAADIQLTIDFNSDLDPDDLRGRIHTIKFAQAREILSESIIVAGVKTSEFEDMVDYDQQHEVQITKICSLLLEEKYQELKQYLIQCWSLEALVPPSKYRYVLKLMQVILSRIEADFEEKNGGWESQILVHRRWALEFAIEVYQLCLRSVILESAESIIQDPEFNALDSEELRSSFEYIKECLEALNRDEEAKALEGTLYKNGCSRRKPAVLT